MIQTREYIENQNQETIKSIIKHSENNEEDLTPRDKEQENTQQILAQKILKRDTYNKVDNKMKNMTTEQFYQNYTN